MSIPITGTFVPSAGDNTFPLLADINLLGGFRVVTNHAARDAISALDRKQGMQVTTNDDGFTWTLGADLVTWTLVTGKNLVTVNRINSSNLGGSKLVDVDTSALTDGVLATVFSVGALFRLVKAPSAELLAAVDGITIVASVATPASIWVRLVTTSDPRFAQNIPLFIDPAAGNDDNDGLLVGTPLKTADEWSRRMNNQVLKTGGTFTITCAAGNIGVLSGTLFCEQTLASGAINLKFNGAVAQSAQVGTVSAIVAQNTATNTEFEFTDSSGVGPVISAASRLRIVSSATPSHVGAVGYARGFDAGGATNPFTSAFQALDGVTEIFPSVGDTYVVETLLTELQNVSTVVMPNGTNNLIPFFTDLFVLDATSSVPALSVSTVFVNSATAPTFITCSFQASTVCRINAPVAVFAGCEFKTQFLNNTPATYTIRTCVFRAGFQVACILTFIGNSVTEAASSANAITAFLSLSGNLLLSRIMAGTGLTTFNIASSTGILWSPLVGARNAMAAGLNQTATSIAQFTNNTTLFNVKATNPHLVTGNPITGFYFDEVSGARFQQGINTEGSLVYLRNLSTAPAVNPPTGSYRMSINGSQVSRGSGGAIESLSPTGGGAAGHASFTSVRYAGGPTNTVNAVTVSIVTSPGLDAPVIVAALDNAGLLAEGTLVGKDGSNNVVTLKVARSFKRIAGVLSPLGGATTPVLGPIGDAALTTAAGVLVASGNSIVLQATGVAATTIAWNGTLTLTSGDFVG